ncbi:uncharacterized protein CANTADRAFT_51913 [Suhomyces tanzawaensis NRRL Y-17324]|uniref:EamA domain-containing protein n=1 Tax=Suhomyces tanzawaensis NRRL Y-17324 TaxID=984487 RepID=A0A1E4SIH3_9ASCO|nr:uncharacterized protein CANTADRAFT_51913 [Suhomyces tanzawaensis NRRL Y-17324]ODV79304.1 hypothetical protein CANTADRAFT_51913 [Suhomyces tanzawaensis NRRL Y-17324]
MSAVTNLKSSLGKYVLAFFLPENNLSSSQKWVLGLINLSSVVVFWVMSSFLVNALVEDDSYRKPFFITYVNTGCFCFYLIPYLKYENLTIAEFLQRLHHDYNSTVHREDEEGLVHDYGSSSNLAGIDGTSISSTVDEHDDDDDNINLYETILLSLQFIALWFSANLVTNASLSYTSVASQTILSSTSSFFTLIIGYLYSVERINQNKIVGILLSFAGVLIVTEIDTSSSTNQNSSLMVLWGNILALAGAMIYGIYTILLKFKISIKHSQKERNLNTHLFFGFVGIFCLVFLWPMLFILHFTGYETFELPPSRLVLTLLLVNALITFVSDFCWCKAVLLTSPLTVTVGLSMTIPLAMIGDWVFKGFFINWWYLFGALIVTLGFFIINKDEKSDFVREEI